MANFLCTDCGKQFIRGDHLTRHKKLLHGSTGEKSTCEFCGQAYKTVESLENHRLTHEPGFAPRIALKNFSCSQCDKKFRDNHDLKRHHKNHLPPQQNQDNEVCGKCQKTFRNDHFKRHKKHVRVMVLSNVANATRNLLNIVSYI